MDIKRIVQFGALIAISSATIILALGAVFAGTIREHLVFAPRERGAESAIQQVAERERAILKSTGGFTAFADKDIKGNPSLLGIFWDRLPVEDFAFDATKLDSGNVQLRALPRPEKVEALSIRARLYVVELKPDGAVVRDGWFPSSD